MIIQVIIKILKQNESDDLLKTETYNLSEEDRNNALRALNVLQSIEDKIKNNKNTLEKNEKVIGNSSSVSSEDKIQSQEAISKSSPNIYNTLINISLFIFIGIVIILLCDQIVELAIQIGMKRTINILQPYLKVPPNISEQIQLNNI